AREHFEFRRMEPAAPGEILDAGKRRRRLLRFDRPRGVVAQAADEFEAEADRADGRPPPVLPPAPSRPLPGGRDASAIQLGLPGGGKLRPYGCRCARFGVGNVSLLPAAIPAGGLHVERTNEHSMAF